jgi:hypothetical protein
MRGNEILAMAKPKGIFLEGRITGTPKPGTVMEIDPAQPEVNGRLGWRVYQPGANGTQAVIAVLDIDHLNGKTYADAYLDGSHCYLYVPVAGEELNMLVTETGTGTGTADNIALGDRLEVQSGTGLLIESTSNTAVTNPFVAMEALTGNASPALLLCMRT